jgi:sterol 24-C-methyltransferase
MDYTNLDFPNETFDAIYTMETLVHAADYSQALQV